MKSLKIILEDCILNVTTAIRMLPNNRICDIELLMVVQVLIPRLNSIIGAVNICV